MILDSGLITLCRLETTTENGAMPKYRLAPVQTQNFGELSVGVTRAYLAKGADAQIDMLVRIYNEGVRPLPTMYAILSYYDGQENEQGDQYQITLVQPHLDDDGLKVYDLTLRRLEENYDETIG